MMSMMSIKHLDHCGASTPEAAKKMGENPQRENLL
jgi:hypothetical protein